MQTVIITFSISCTYAVISGTNVYCMSDVTHFSCGRNLHSIGTWRFDWDASRGIALNHALRPVTSLNYKSNPGLTRSCMHRFSYTGNPVLSFGDLCLYHHYFFVGMNTSTASQVGP
jgi:hypothetical protein